jgi:hypothetical protein
MTWHRELTDVYHFACDPDGHGVTVEFTTPTGPRSGHISATQIHIIDEELARRRHEQGEE